MTNGILKRLRVLVAVGYYLLVAFPLVVSAADQVTLGWDGIFPAPDGYNLYQRVQGQGYDYDNPVNDELITGTTLMVDGIEQGVHYYFVVSAVVDDDESEDSNELEYIDMGMGGNGIDDSVSFIGSTASSEDVGMGCFIGSCRGDGAQQSGVGLNLFMAGLLTATVAIFNIRRIIR